MPPPKALVSLIIVFPILFSTAGCECNCGSEYMRQAQIAEDCIQAKNISPFDSNLRRAGGGNQTGGTGSGSGGFAEGQEPSTPQRQQPARNRNDVVNNLYGNEAMSLTNQPRPDWHQNITNTLNSFFGNPSNVNQSQPFTAFKIDLASPSSLSLIDCDPVNFEILTPDLAVMRQFGAQNASNEYELQIFWYRYNNEWIPFHADDRSTVDPPNCGPGGWGKKKC